MRTISLPATSEIAYVVATTMVTSITAGGLLRRLRAAEPEECEECIHRGGDDCLSRDSSQVLAIGRADPWGKGSGKWIHRECRADRAREQWAEHDRRTRTTIFPPCLGMSI